MRQIVRTGRALVLVACAVAGSWVLAGCGAASTAARPDALTDLVDVADPAVLDLLTRSGSYRPGEQTLRAAEDRLVGRCMAAKGLSYPSAPPPADRRTDEERTLDLAARHRNGYGLAGSAGRSAAAGAAVDSGPALDRYVQTLPAAGRAAYTLALFGPEDERRAIELPVSGQVSFPGAGCLHDAQSRIYDDIVTWARISYLPEDLNNVLTRKVTGSPAYALALRGWAACMAGRGHPYDSPRAAEDDLAARYDAAGPSSRLRGLEIDVAVADGECARTAKLPAQVRTLKAAAVGELPADQQRALSEAAWAWQRAVSVATRLMAAG